jgi:membrane protease YdiL (CAAX protease family)
MGCLLELWRDREAIETLERFSRSQNSSISLAALFYLGRLQQWKENRAGARAAWESLIRDYGASYETYTREERAFIDSARTSLEHADTFQYCPLVDWAVYGTRRLLRVQRTPSDPISLEASILLLILVPLGMRLMALWTVLALAWIGSFIWPRDERIARLFARRFSLVRVGLLFMLVWVMEAGIRLLNQTLWSFAGSSQPSIHASGAIQIFLPILPGILAILICLHRERVGRILDLRVGVRAYAAGMVGGFALIVVSASIPLLAEYLGGNFVTRSLQGTYDASQGPLPLRLIRLLNLVLLMPVTEELLYRGVLLDSLRSTISPWYSGLLSSTLFATGHLAPLHETLALIVTGLLLNWIRDKYASLAPGTLAHAVANAVLLMPSS